MTRMRRGRRVLRPWQVLACGLLGLASGCGLEEYDKKAQSEAERVSSLDEEQRLLTTEIQIPPSTAERKEGAPPPQNPPDIYYRPPKGIVSNQGREVWPGTIYFFPSTSYVDEEKTKGAQASPLGLQGIYIGAAGGSPADLKDALAAALKIPPLQPNGERLSIKSFDRKGATLDFDRFRGDKREEPPLFTVYCYICTDEGLNLVVALRFNGTEPMPPATEEALKCSLGTLATGNHARIMRTRSNLPAR